MYKQLFKILINPHAYTQEGLSQGGDLERDDEDANLLHKSMFYGDSERKHRSSAFSSSLTWDSDSEKETFDGIFCIFITSPCIIRMRLYSRLARLLAPFIKRNIHI